MFVYKDRYESTSGSCCRHYKNFLSIEDCERQPSTFSFNTAQLGHRHLMEEGVFTGRVDDFYIAGGMLRTGVICCEGSEMHGESVSS